MHAVIFLFLALLGSGRALSPSITLGQAGEGT